MNEAPPTLGRGRSLVQVESRINRMKRLSAGIVTFALASAAGTAGAVTLLSTGSTPVLKVTLKEFRVVSPVRQVASGRVTFVARNGGETEHELVIVRARGRDRLPIKKHKAIEGNAVVGEVEDIAPGKTGRVTLKLKPGRYFLICNLVGHYQLGMRTTLRAM
jgi:uncharacterized cupredoxin-like copper-binding protein